MHFIFHDLKVHPFNKEEVTFYKSKFLNEEQYKIVDISNHISTENYKYFLILNLVPRTLSDNTNLYNVFDKNGSFFISKFLFDILSV